MGFHRHERLDMSNAVSRLSDVVERSKVYAGFSYVPTPCNRRTASHTAEE